MPEDKTSSTIAIQVPNTNKMDRDFLDNLVGGRPVKIIVTSHKHTRDIFEDEHFNPPDKHGMVRLCSPAVVTLSNGIKVKLTGPSTYNHSIVHFV